MSYSSDYIKVLNSENKTGGIVVGAPSLSVSQFDLFFRKYSNEVKNHKRYYQTDADTPIFADNIQKFFPQFTRFQVVQLLYLIRVLGNGSSSYSGLILAKYKVRNYSDKWKSPNSISPVFVAAIAASLLLIIK